MYKRCRPVCHGRPLVTPGLFQAPLHSYIQAMAVVWLSNPWSHPPVAGLSVHCPSHVVAASRFVVLARVQRRGLLACLCFTVCLLVVSRPDAGKFCHCLRRCCRRRRRYPGVVVDVGSLGHSLPSRESQPGRVYPAFPSIGIHPASAPSQLRPAYSQPPGPRVGGRPVPSVT